MPRTKEEKVLCMGNDKTINKTDAHMSQKMIKNETVISMVSLLHYREDLCTAEVLLQCLQHRNFKWYKLKSVQFAFSF